MVNIDSQEQLLDYALQVFAGRAEPEEVALSDAFNIHIKLQGDEWDGLIDYRIAKFVLNLQKDLFEIYSAASDDTINFKSSAEAINKVRVKVKVTQGCTEIEAFIKEALGNMLNKLNDRQTVLIIVLLIIFTAGYLAFQNHNEKEVEIEKIKSQTSLQIEDEKTKRKALDLVGEARKQSKETHQSAKYLVSQMSSKDLLVLPNANKELSKKEAQTLIEDPDGAPSLHNYCVDGKYSLLAIDLKEWYVRIGIENIKFQASTKSLTSLAIHRLYETIEKAHKIGETPSLDLQVVADVEGGKIKQAYITGIGEKRQDAVAVKDVLSLPKLERAKKINLPLFDG